MGECQRFGVLDCTRGLHGRFASRAGVVVGPHHEGEQPVPVQRERFRPRRFFLTAVQHSRQKSPSSERVAGHHPETPDICSELSRFVIVSALDQRASRNREGLLLRKELLRPSVLIREYRTTRRRGKPPPHFAGTLEQAVRIFPTHVSKAFIDFPRKFGGTGLNLT